MIHFAIWIQQQIYNIIEHNIVYLLLYFILLSAL